MSQIIRLLLGIAISFVSAASSAEIYIKSGEAKTKKSQMAFPALQYFGSPNQPNFARIGSEIYNTIYNDLSVSSLFLMMDSKAFLEDPAKTALTPAPSPANGFQFQNWSSIGADFLIRAGFSIAGDEVTIETYTYQVSQARLVFGKKYKSTVSQSRRMAHTFVNDVLEALTGTEGPFLSKFVVASDRSGGSAREIYTMDWDGANVQAISNHKSITISPAWSPDSKKIAYTAYVIRSGTKERNANLVLHDVVTGKKVLISYRKGMNSGASFDPDGKHIYLTISQNQNPDIYKMTLDGTIVKTITKGPNGAMNVEPNISQDGKKLVFSSDRAGRPMIYTSSDDGDGVIRRTFEGTFNSSPAWSPDGKKIAFSGQADGHFDIFIMDADGKNIKRITSAKKANGKWSSNEDPSFSPDGRFVVYTSNRTGSNQIFISNIEGTEERQVTNDRHNYYKPRWSRNQ